MSPTDNENDNARSLVFSGFDIPEQNWCKMPLALIENMWRISSLAEMKVIFYILRHTWGYHEYDCPKHITLDEFENGRKRKDGSRIDSGVGMVRNSIKSGLKSAEEHGFILITTDDSDKARIEKSYRLNMYNSGGQILTPYELEGQKLTLGNGVRGAKVDPRTEKDTSFKKDTLSLPSSSIEEEGTHPASNQLWYTPNEGDPILVTVLGKTPKRIKIQLPDGSEVAVTEKRLSEEKPEAAGPTLTADGWRAWGVAVARLIPELEKRYPGNIGMQRSYIKWLAGDMGMDETEARGFTLYIEASDEALYARERWLKRETIEGWLNKFRAGGLYPVYMERAARQLMAEAQPAPEPEPDEDIEYADRDAVRAVLAQIGIGV